MNRRKKVGISAGIAGGFFWGLDPHIFTFLFLMVPFVDGDATFKLGIIGVAGMAAFFKEIFALILVSGFQAVKGDLVASFQTLNSKDERKAWGWVAISAIVSGPIATTCYAISVSMAGPAWPAMITAIYPVIAAIGGAIFLKDKLTPKGWVGVGIIGVGMLLLSMSNPQTDALPLLTLGIIIAGITAVSWGSEGVILSVGLRNSKLTSTQCVLIRNIVATSAWFLIMVPFVARPDGFKFILEVIQHPLTLFITMIYALNMLIDLVLYYKSIDMIGPGKAAGLNITYVIFALVFGFLINSVYPSYGFVPPTMIFYIVGACIIAGDILILSKNADAEDSSLLKLDEK